MPILTSFNYEYVQSMIRCLYFNSIILMLQEISINISKILNWCLTNNNTKLQIAFYSAKSRSYLAHKSTIGYFNAHTLTLNTSFRINYEPSEHTIICKISDLRDRNDVKEVGQIEIDLKLLSQRRVLFVPFQELDKVLEIKLYQPKNQSIQHDKVLTDEQAEQKREQFLQERFDFLDKLNEHESQLKKKFSQKVYNLLKQRKTKSHELIQYLYC